MEIKDILEQRNISCLYHFTRVENLKSILENGLVPRKEISNSNCMINDYYRHDHCKGANCLSVGFPNYKMFYSLRHNSEDSKWVVLVFDANILKKYKCAFCYSNAGSEEIYSIPLEYRMREKAFEGMFADREGYPSRRILQIPDCYPTNPQAEVLLFGTVPSKYIKAIAFNNKDVLEKYEKIIPKSINIKVYNRLFSPRKDYDYWKKVEF